MGLGGWVDVMHPILRRAFGRLSYLFRLIWGRSLAYDCIYEDELDGDDEYEDENEDEDGVSGSWLRVVGLRRDERTGSRACREDGRDGGNCR